MEKNKAICMIDCMRPHEFRGMVAMLDILSQEVDTVYLRLPDNVPLPANSWRPGFSLARTRAATLTEVLRGAADADVALYYSPELAVKPGDTAKFVKIARSGVGLQVVRAPETQAARRPQYQNWLKTAKPGADAGKLLFARQGFICINSSLAGVEIPAELADSEATLLLNYATAASIRHQPAQPSVFSDVTAVKPQAAPQPAPRAPVPQPVPMKPATQPARPATPGSDVLHRVWDCRDAVVAVYPELEKSYDEMRARISAPGCAQCVKNSTLRQLLQEIDKVNTGYRDFSAFDKAGIPELGAALKSRAPQAGYQDRGPRPTCLNCTRKHIGQAVVLLAESVLGYPQHRWLAVGHLAEASEECVETYPRLAEEMRFVRNKLADDPGFLPNLMELFDKVDSAEKANAAKKP